MPTLSIYVNDQIYGYLLQIGVPSKTGKAWVEERYAKEIKHAQKREIVHMGLDG